MAEEGLEITFFVLLSVCTVHNITLFDHYSFFIRCCSAVQRDCSDTHSIGPCVFTGPLCLSFEGRLNGPFDIFPASHVLHMYLYVGIIQ